MLCGRQAPHLKTFVAGRRSGKAPRQLVFPMQAFGFLMLRKFV
jgi:hypothetical protein